MAGHRRGRGQHRRAVQGLHHLAGGCCGGGQLHFHEPDRPRDDDARHLPCRHRHGTDVGGHRPGAGAGAHLGTGLADRCAGADLRRAEEPRAGAQDRGLCLHRGLGGEHRRDRTGARLAHRAGRDGLRHLPALPRPAAHDEVPAGKGSGIHRGHRRDRDRRGLDPVRGGRGAGRARGLHGHGRVRGHGRHDARWWPLRPGQPRWQARAVGEGHGGSRPARRGRGEVR